MDQALILPTHDPRKPWVTRTPRPTATPWLTLAATFAPQRPAPSAPAENAAQVAADAARIDTVPESGGVTAPGALSPKATAIQPVGAPSPNLSSLQSVERTGLTSSAQAELTKTPTPTGMLPTETLVAPTGIPSLTPSQGANQPLPPITPGDAAQFGIYVRDHYNTIAGQPMEIAAVTVDTTEADRPKVVVEVLGNDANNVFAAQPAAAVLDYGRRLLDDTKFYSAAKLARSPSSAHTRPPTAMPASTIRLGATSIRSTHRPTPGRSPGPTCEGLRLMEWILWIPATQAYENQVQIVGAGSEASADEHYVRPCLWAKSAAWVRFMDVEKLRSDAMERGIDNVSGQGVN